MTLSTRERGGEATQPPRRFQMIERFVRILAAERSNPFAGAMRSLRSIDPLYQAEIGIEREWEIDVEINSHGCDCSYCIESKVITAIAHTAAEAIRNAQPEIERGGIIVGVRPLGSNGDFADADEVLETEL